MLIDNPLYLVKPSERQVFDAKPFPEIRRATKVWWFCPHKQKWLDEIYFDRNVAIKRADSIWDYTDDFGEPYKVGIASTFLIKNSKGEWREIMRKYANTKDKPVQDSSKLTSVQSP